MTIAINPAWLQAGFAFGLIDECGNLRPEVNDWRWATIEDAKHDWERIANGLKPERTIPKLTCKPSASTPTENAGAGSDPTERQ